MPVYRTASEEETIALGQRIGRDLGPGTVVLLIGNLGAGKTTIAKGLVSGLEAGDPDEVASPTFTLIHEYGQGRVYHLDLYRIEREEDLHTLGIEDLLDGQAVVLVEWGERFPEAWPEQRVEIELRAEGQGREIEVRRRGG